MSDSSAHTMDDIARLFERMHFKKRLIGGVEERDVWKQLDEVQAAYRRVYEAQHERDLAIIEDRERTIEELEARLRDLERRAGSAPYRGAAPGARQSTGRIPPGGSTGRVTLSSDTGRMSNGNTGRITSSGNTGRMSNGNTGHIAPSGDTVRIREGMGSGASPRGDAWDGKPPADDPGIEWLDDDV